MRTKRVRKGKTPAPKPGEASPELNPCIKSTIDVSSSVAANKVNGDSSKFPRSQPYYGRVSVMNYLGNTEKGIQFCYGNQKVYRKPLVSYISKLAVSNVINIFDRRVTALEWHPNIPGRAAVASKSGDVLLVTRKSNTYKVLECISGPGKPGSIQGMRFAANTNHLYTVSVFGTCVQLELETLKINNILNCDPPNNFSHWFTAIDVLDRALVVGDNKGSLFLLSDSGECQWKKKICSNKISHCEVNKKCPWLLATTSLDKVVKLWDIRYIGGAKDFLVSLPHSSAINSAYFSPTSGSKLLTTDQQDQIRVYSGPLWKLDTQIQHPHRHYQYITPIKATWCPLDDIIVVGRYPNPKHPEYTPNERNTIDFFDSDTGECLYQLWNKQYDKIHSLNHFSPSGDILASGVGRQVFFWELGKEADITFHLPKDHPFNDDDDDNDDYRPDLKRKRNSKKNSKLK